MAQTTAKCSAPTDFELLVGIIKPLDKVASSNATKNTLGKTDFFFTKLGDEVGTLRGNSRHISQGDIQVVRVAGSKLTSALEIIHKSIKDVPTDIHEVCLINFPHRHLCGA